MRKSTGARSQVAVRIMNAIHPDKGNMVMTKPELAKFCASSEKRIREVLNLLHEVGLTRVVGYRLRFAVGGPLLYMASGMDYPTKARQNAPKPP